MHGGQHFYLFWSIIVLEALCAFHQECPDRLAVAVATTVIIKLAFHLSLDSHLEDFASRVTSIDFEASIPASTKLQVQ